MRQESSGKPGPFQLMAKPAGPACNLNCRYCFYLDKQRLFPGATRHAMSDGTLEAYVRQYIESQETPVVMFVWQGGEPTLLGVDFFEKALAFQRRYAGGKRIENALQTNAVLIDDRWAEFLAAHEFLVGVSLDGPRDLHDVYRVDRGGSPTFDRVMNGLTLLKDHGVAFNTLTTLNDRNAAEPRRIYQFLKEVGSGFVQFIPVVERVGGGASGGGVPRVSPESVKPAQFGRFMCAVFDQWVRDDVGRVFVQLFDVTLQAWVGEPPGLCVFDETCGRAMIVEHNGDVYSCDHYVDPEHKIGNLLDRPLAEMAELAAQRNFGDQKRRLAPACRDCDWLFACHGDCPKHRFAPSLSADLDISYLCEGYRRFFDHVSPFMEYMAAELREGRPPANVMRVATGLARRDGDRRPAGRNDPCPCGSGRKRKKCCG
jgi:uncharacterized protein